MIPIYLKLLTPLPKFIRKSITLDRHFSMLYNIHCVNISIYNVLYNKFDMELFQLTYRNIGDSIKNEIAEIANKNQ